jgi:hypothetical protein
MSPTRKFWLRLYAELAENRKVQTLEPVLFKAYINLLCLAARHDGAVPCLEDVIWTLRCSEADATGWIAALSNKGLIDSSDGTLRMHDWDDYQVADGTERSRKSRNKSNGSEPQPPPGNGQKKDATRMQRASPLHATRTQLLPLESQRKKESEILDSDSESAVSIFPERGKNRTTDDRVAARRAVEARLSDDPQKAEKILAYISDAQEVPHPLAYVETCLANAGRKRTRRRAKPPPEAQPPPAVPSRFVRQGSDEWQRMKAGQGGRDPIVTMHHGDAGTWVRSA